MIVTLVKICVFGYYQEAFDTSMELYELIRLR